MATQRERRIRRPPPDYRYVFLLVLLSFIVRASAPAGNGTDVVSVLIQSFALVLALRTARASDRLQRVVRVLVVLAVVVTVVSTASGAGNGSAIAGIITALLVALTPVYIVRDMIREPIVSLQTMWAALTVYLLIGMFFAALYGAVAAIGSGPFFAQGTDGTGPERLYFSFVTQTTTGYGDFTAASQFGRTLSVVEAMLGQLYLVTVVSLIVGRVQRVRPQEDD
jgi:ion channel